MTAAATNLPEPGDLAWDGQVLTHDPDHPALAKLRRPSLSPSTSNAMQGCRARWVGEKLLGDDPDPFNAANKGNAVHAVLEDLYGLPPQRRTTKAAFGLLLKLAERHPRVRQPTDPIEQAQWRDQVQLAMSGLWGIEEPTEVTGLIQREMKFDGVEINGVPVTGFIDRLDPVVDKDGNPGYRMVDFKTGKWKTQDALKRYGDSEAEQQRIYALALRELTGALPETAQLYYTAVGKSRTIQLGPRLLKATATTLADSWQRLTTSVEGGRWPAQPSGLCNYCPFATVCPAAATRDKPVDPKTEAFRLGEALFPTIGHRPPSPQEPPTEPDGEPPPETEIRHTTPTDSTTTTVADQEPDMSTDRWKYEDKPFEETTNGDLNANSYAAGAVFGTATLALDLLHNAGQPVNATTVKPMALTLSSLVLEVQKELSGSANFQRGFNTRLRGALREVLNLVPPPFGGTEQDWATWHTTVKAYLVATADAAHVVWDSGLVDRPFAPLVNATVPATPTTVNA